MKPQNQAFFFRLFFSPTSSFFSGGQNGDFSRLRRLALLSGRSLSLSLNEGSGFPVQPRSGGRRRSSEGGQLPLSIPPRPLSFFSFDR